MSSSAVMQNWLDGCGEFLCPDVDFDPMEGGEFLCRNADLFGWGLVSFSDVMRIWIDRGGEFISRDADFDRMGAVSFSAMIQI